MIFINYSHVETVPFYGFSHKAFRQFHLCEVCPNTSDFKPVLYCIWKPHSEKFHQLIFDIEYKGTLFEEEKNLALRIYTCGQVRSGWKGKATRKRLVPFSKGTNDAPPPNWALLLQQKNSLFFSLKKNVILSQITHLKISYSAISLATESVPLYSTWPGTSKDAPRSFLVNVERRSRCAPICRLLFWQAVSASVVAGRGQCWKFRSSHIIFPETWNASK